MEDGELQRRVHRPTDFLGVAKVRNGLFQFIDDEQAEEMSENPVVSFRGPTTRVVRRTFAEAGFRVGVSKEQFNILWGNPQNSDFLKAMQPGQVIAHLAGQYCITRKDSLAETLYNAAKRCPAFGKIAPKSFSLPSGFSAFKAWASVHKGYYVLKLATAARGEGVKVISWDEEFKKNADAVVQEYIANPLLIEGRKFDLRLYVCVTSVEPLVGYLFQEGLGRFASEPFQPPSKTNEGNKSVHLTNYSVNKKADKEINEIKWTFTEILQWLDQNYKGVSVRMWEDEQPQSGIKLPQKDAARPPTRPKSTRTPAEHQQFEEKRSASSTPAQHAEMSPSQIALENIKHCIRLTLLAAEPTLVSQASICGMANFPRKQFGFFGFDVMLCSDLSARLVEVNVNPSTATEHDVDKRLKYWMLRDMLQLVSVPATVTKGKLLVPKMGERSASGIRGAEFKLEPGEKRCSMLNLSQPVEESGLSRYEKLVVQQIRSEETRIGAFQSLFPCKRYAPYFESRRYLNELVQALCERK